MAALIGEEALTEAAPPPERLTGKERRTLSDQASLTRFDTEQLYINGLIRLSPRQRQARDEVAYFIGASRGAIPGPRDSLYVIGDPGHGKSLAIRVAAWEHHRKALVRLGIPETKDPEIIEDGFRSKVFPVLWLTVRADAEKKSVVAQIANQFGYEGDTNRSASWITDHIPHYVRSHHTTCVVLDDIHNLATERKDAVHLFNLVKNLNTELGTLGVTTIYITNPDENGRLPLEPNPQLGFRLVPFVFEDMKFDRGTHGNELPENLVWRDYLWEWEQALQIVLPDMEQGDLCSALGPLVWKRTHGRLGGVAGLLKRATTETLSQAGPKTRLTLTQDRLARTEMPLAYRLEKK